VPQPQYTWENANRTNAKLMILLTEPNCPERAVLADDPRERARRATPRCDQSVSANKYKA
jgi:heme exporter protein D